MKLFFLIVCHKNTPSLLYNLRKFATFKNSQVLIHIDKKSNFTEKELVSADNLKYMKERLNVRWGSISQVIATYKMLNMIKNEDFDYVSLMSGEDLFIRSEDEFILFLNQHESKEFIGVQKSNNKFYNPRNRFMYRYSSSFFNFNPSVFTKFSKILNTFLFKLGFLKNNKTIPYDEFYKGSNWFTVSKQAVGLIIKEIDEKNLLNYFKDSFCIDEVIFQTILINNGFQTKFYLVNDNATDNKMSLRYINWIDGPEYPKILNKKDLIQKFDSDIFFVRKVTSELNESELFTLLKKKNDPTDI